eukprot:CAMPEP_0115843942 /NCGR_PEP_ID=MMETSP0287-20121206/8574_1 /TAXON_ID=412157 /ORGANISM="Chrysochromulina rotalis, Strain UIO044" /LENGTH=73 /DNA_ID=CAMNT_0003297655 /DNA_START=45 /DNA_END=266 /DNA_ORIENTATION=+
MPAHSIEYAYYAPPVAKALRVGACQISAASPAAAARGRPTQPRKHKHLCILPGHDCVANCVHGHEMALWPRQT